MLGSLETEEQWPSMSARARTAIIVPAGCLALAGAVWALADPGRRSYIVGGLMTGPLITLVLPVLTRDTHDYPAAPDGAWGPPSF